MSLSKRRALWALRSTPEVVMKPADKGSSIVVMDRAVYIQEAEANYKYYNRLEGPIYPQNIERINNTLNRLWMLNI
jgi:hypothetical protein